MFLGFKRIGKKVWKKIKQIFKCCSILGAFMELYSGLYTMSTKGRWAANMAEKHTKLELFPLLANLLGWNRYQIIGHEPLDIEIAVSSTTTYVVLELPETKNIKNLGVFYNFRLFLRYFWPLAPLYPRGRAGNQKIQVLWLTPEILIPFSTL